MRRRARLALLALLVALGAGCAGRRAPAAPDPGRLAAALSGMIWPLPIPDHRPITSPYGRRGRRHHDGIDIDGRTGDTVYAARAGRVRHSGWRGGYGLAVVLDHGDGVTTLYGHASRLLAAAGQEVRRGEPIALIGATGEATGDHLHFEIAWAGYPLDPAPLLPRLRPR